MRRDVSTTCMCMLFALVGCSGPNGNGSDAGDTSSNGEPLNLAATRLGTTFHHGEAGILEAAGSTANQAGDRAEKVFGTAFLDVQMYDEHSWRFGEWEYYSPVDDSNYRKAGHFRSNKGDGDFKPRTADLKNELEGTFGEVGSGGFDQLGIVFDVWRSRGDWYVHWEGELQVEENRIGEGNYGFFLDRMTSDISTQINETVRAHRPDYLVVGSDMGRLLARKNAPGVAPDDFSNFRQFYDSVVADIRGVSPNTTVGVGFHWDHFVKYVAPAYGKGEKGSVPPRETLERAFRSVIYPLAQTGGMLALKSYRKPGDDVGYYDFLATLDEKFDMDGIEFVWYSIGSPVSSSASYRSQRAYLNDFVEWNRGVGPDLVVWRSLLNIEDSARCDPLVESKRFDMPKRHCFDGLFDATFNAKEVFETLEMRATGGN